MINVREKVININHSMYETLSYTAALTGYRLNICLRFYASQEHNSAIYILYCVDGRELFWMNQRLNTEGVVCRCRKCEKAV